MKMQMLTLYTLFKEGEQEIIPSVKIQKASSESKLKLNHISSFLYNLNSFFLILVITMLIAKNENLISMENSTINNQSISSTYLNEVNQKSMIKINKNNNILTFLFFEVHIVIFGLIYQQFIFIKDNTFIQTKKFTMKEFVIISLVNIYLQISDIYTRYDTVFSFFENYLLLFMLYNIFTDKNSNSNFNINVFSALISGVLMSYVSSILCKIRICIICYNYLAIIPKVMLYLQKSNSKFYLIQLLFPIVNLVFLIIISVYNNKYLFDMFQKINCFNMFSQVSVVDEIEFIVIFKEIFNYYNYWGFNVFNMCVFVFFANLITIFLYPLLVNYLSRKYKIRYFGKWDLPEVTNYY